MKFYPLTKGLGVEKVVALKGGGHNTFWGSFNKGA